jgi:hypothetical protein
MERRRRTTIRAIGMSHEQIDDLFSNLILNVLKQVHHGNPENRPSVSVAKWTRPL